MSEKISSSALKPALAAAMRIACIELITTGDWSGFVAQIKGINRVAQAAQPNGDTEAADAMSGYFNLCLNAITMSEFERGVVMAKLKFIFK